MLPPSTIKRQFLVAAYTSPVISALTVTPVYMLSGSTSQEYPLTILLFAALFFIMWTINIAIYSGLSRGREDAGPAWRRYLISYGISMILTGGALHWVIASGAHPDIHIKGAGFHFHVIVFFAVDTVLLILQDLVVTREKNAQLRIRNMEAMNMQLKQQIQPHFLFNSLSTLKSLITYSPELAGEYLVRLSGFLRASIASHSDHVVRLERELELCSDYLEMQRIRFGDALQYRIEVPSTIRSERHIPIFSLQLLLENAIKHNTMTVELPLHISIGYADEVITVRNNVQRRPDAEPSAGTGLANLRERYVALTGRGIVIQQDADYFSVGLNVLTHDSRDH